MDTVVSRLESGRAILEDLPRVGSPGSSLVSLRPERGAGGKEIPGAWQGEMRHFRDNSGESSHKSAAWLRFPAMNVCWIPARASFALLFSGFALAGPPVIDDEAVITAMQSTLEAAVGKAGIPSADELGKLAKSKKRSQPEIPLPGTPAAPPAATYEALCKSVYLIGSLYKCGKCDDWHQGGTATAWCIGSDGLMITNAHVFRSAEGGIMGVTDREGRCYPVTALLGWDMSTDVAVFRVDAKDLQALPLGAAAEVGADITVISHPGGNHFVRTSGSISRYVKRPLGRNGDKVTWMAITADYAKGSSGGPVFNDAGQVVGMVSNTLSLYTGSKAKPANKGDLQMVIKHCVPGDAIRELFQKPAEAETAGGVNP